MIPIRSALGSKTLPDEAIYKIPELEDIGDEGFGCFRDTWTILSIPLVDAHSMVKKEEVILRDISKIAQNEAEFERLALTIEAWDEDAVTPETTGSEILNRYKATDDYSVLEGLELGVTGLVYTLSAIGALPAASCRSHFSPHTWSTSPIVLFASELHTAKFIETHLEDTECVFTLDEYRPSLLAITAPSTMCMVELAKSLISMHAESEP